MHRYFGLITITVATLVFTSADPTARFALGEENPQTHDAIQPVPRDGRWMKRHESMNSRVAEGNVDLVFIGDSITQGWEGRGKAVWAEYYGDRNAVNLGIGGDRTQHVIWRLQNGNLKDIHPKAAVIMIGTNNSGDDTAEQIAEAQEAAAAMTEAVDEGVGGGLSDSPVELKEDDGLLGTEL